MLSDSISTSTLRVWWRWKYKFRKDIKEIRPFYLISKPLLLSLPIHVRTIRKHVTHGNHILLVFGSLHCILVSQKDIKPEMYVQWSFLLTNHFFFKIILYYLNEDNWKITLRVLSVKKYKLQHQRSTSLFIGCHLLVPSGEAISHHRFGMPHKNKGYHVNYIIGKKKKPQDKTSEKDG